MESHSGGLDVVGTRGHGGLHGRRAVPAVILCSEECLVDSTADKLECDRVAVKYVVERIAGLRARTGLRCCEVISGFECVIRDGRVADEGLGKIRHGYARSESEPAIIFGRHRTSF